MLYFTNLVNSGILEFLYLFLAFRTSVQKLLLVSWVRFTLKLYQYLQCQQFIVSRVSALKCQYLQTFINIWYFLMFFQNQITTVKTVLLNYTDFSTLTLPLQIDKNNSNSRNILDLELLQCNISNSTRSLPSNIL